MKMRCPFCGSTNIRPSKFTLIQGTVREYGCLDCLRYEDRLTSDPDFSEMRSRWVIEDGEQEASEKILPTERDDEA